MALTGHRQAKNGRLQPGTGGRLQTESVVAFDRNTHAPGSHGSLRQAAGGPAPRHGVSALAGRGGGPGVQGPAEIAARSPRRSGWRRNAEERTGPPLRRTARPRRHPSREPRASGPPRRILPDRPAPCSRAERRRAARRQTGGSRAGCRNLPTAAERSARHSWHKSCRGRRRRPRLPATAQDRGQPDTPQDLAFTGDGASRAG